MTTLSASVHEWSAGRRASGFVQVGIAPGISIRPIPPVKRRSGPKRWPGSHGGRRCPHLGLRLLPDRRSQHIVSADSITYASDPHPGIVHCGQGCESALGMIRKWLCSAFRMGQPQRDSAPSQSVSGVNDLPSHPSATPPILASFPHPGEAARVSPRLPPGQLLSILTVSHGEILYFRPPANQKRKLPYDLASFRCLPPAPSTLFSIAWKPRPTTTTRTSASPFAAASNAMVAADCPPKLMLLPPPVLPAPAPRRAHSDPLRQPYPTEILALTQIRPNHRAP